MLSESVNVSCIALALSWHTYKYCGSVIECVEGCKVFTGKRRWFSFTASHTVVRGKHRHMFRYATFHPST